MPIFTKNQGLLYPLLKLASRLAIRLLCREIRINNPEVLQEKGPILLAANHPNSFFDSILLDTLFEEPVWALARGDAFRNKNHAQLLRQQWIRNRKTMVMPRMALHIGRLRHVAVDALGAAALRLVESVCEDVDDRCFGKLRGAPHVTAHAQRVAGGDDLCRVRIVAIKAAHARRVHLAA